MRQQPIDLSQLAAIGFDQSGGILDPVAAIGVGHAIVIVQRRLVVMAADDPVAPMLLGKRRQPLLEIVPCAERVIDAR